MRRNLADIVFQDGAEQGYRPGDEHAHRAAAALADRFDAPTIIALTDAFSFLKSMGGQLFVITLRERVDIAGNLVDEKEPGGEWRTIAMRVAYETQDGRVAAAKPPKEILGVEVTEFREPPTRVELGAATEVPEDEHDLRDEIEAEADALPDPRDEQVALTD